MKKLFCILLALSLMCALFVGCSSDGDSAESPSAEPSDSAEPSESAQASDDANAGDGETYSMGFVMMGSGEFFQAISEALVAGFEEIGWDASFANGEFDPATQIEQIENYAAMGTDVIIIHPVSGSTVNGAVDTAREAGSKVVILADTTVENWDGMMSSDNVATGLANAWMCAQFVEERWPDAEPGSITVAALTYTGVVTDAEQSEGLLRVGEYSDKISVFEYQLSEGTMEAGMAAAENLYVEHPEITLFICTSNQVAMGVNNYFAGMNSPISDYSDYGVWGTNSAEEALNAIQETAAGNGIFRGINVQSGIPETVRTAIDIATGLMDGTYDHIDIPANVYLVTTENVDEWMENEHVDLRWDYENNVGITEPAEDTAA